MREFLGFCFALFVCVSHDKSKFSWFCLSSKKKLRNKKKMISTNIDWMFSLSLFCCVFCLNRNRSNFNVKCTIFGKKIYNVKTYICLLIYFCVACNSLNRLLFCFCECKHKQNKRIISLWKKIKGLKIQLYLYCNISWH